MSNKRVKKRTRKMRTKAKYNKHMPYPNTPDETIEGRSQEDIPPFVGGLFPKL